MHLCRTVLAFFHEYFPSRMCLCVHTPQPDSSWKGLDIFGMHTFKIRYDQIRCDAFTEIINVQDDSLKLCCEKKPIQENTSLKI